MKNKYNSHLYISVYTISRVKITWKIRSENVIIITISYHIFFAETQTKHKVSSHSARNSNDLSFIDSAP